MPVSFDKFCINAWANMKLYSIGSQPLPSTLKWIRPLGQEFSCLIVFVSYLDFAEISCRELQKRHWEVAIIIAEKVIKIDHQSGRYSRAKCEREQWDTLLETHCGSGQKQSCPYLEFFRHNYLFSLYCKGPCISPARV